MQLFPTYFRYRDTSLRKCATETLMINVSRICFIDEIHAMGLQYFDIALSLSRNVGVHLLEFKNNLA